MKTRFELINKLIKENGYSSYLEIGVRDCRDCYDKIEAEDKTAVDPEYKRKPNVGNVVTATSDDFFEANEKMFDIVFIDGMHEEEYVVRDVENSLKFLNEGGAIVLHDCNPLSADRVVPFSQYDGKMSWNGTTYKGFLKFRSDENLEVYCHDFDHGCGVIKRGSQDTIELPEEYGFEEFDANRKEWLNLI